jgi:hypothetical protein
MNSFVCWAALGALHAYLESSEKLLGERNVSIENHH